MRLRKPSSTQSKLVNADNLHRIAISNLDDHEYALKRWWHQKYQIPPKPIDDYTVEELYVEYLEDFYDKHPDERARLDRKVETVEWDGTEKFRGEDEALAMLKRIRKKQGKTVDLEKYRTDDEFSEEELEKIMASIGKTPRPKLSASGPTLGNDEFDDDFGRKP